jgi:Zn-dependent protease with chaperone function
MFTDDDEPQWTQTFFARICACLGALLLAGIYYYWFALLYLGAVADSGIRDFARQVLILNCIPGVFVLTALLLDIRRDHSSEADSWMTRFMRNAPLLSIYPHPLRWILGFELSLWLFAAISSGAAAFLSHPR